MKQKRRMMLLSIALVIFLAFSNMLVHAAQEKVGFAVRPELPKNQIDAEVSYFYLNMQPEQEQTLQVLVVNKNDEDIDVELQANPAYTNQNGLIDYNNATQNDIASPIKFSDLVAIDEPILTVPAHGTAVAEFRLTMPKDSFEGDILGGLIFTKMPPEAQSDEQEVASAEPNAIANGMMIKNVFNYCVALRLTESDQVVTPDFIMTEALMGEVAGFPALVLNINNPKPLVAKDVQLDVQVYTKDRTLVLSFDAKSFSMAPISSMGYSILLRGEQSLAAGVYDVEVEMRYEDQAWQYKAPLTVNEK